MREPVQIAAPEVRPAGAPTADIGFHVFVANVYLAPFVVGTPLIVPLQTTISEPVHTMLALCCEGPLAIVDHVSPTGSYRLPPFAVPPHMSIRVPVHNPVCPVRGGGTPAPCPVGRHRFACGSYRPPVESPEDPLQTIISKPVQTAECPVLAVGAPAVDVADQESVAGS